MQLTNEAAIKVAEFLVKHKRPDALLRVRVVGGGCSGFQYQLALDDESRDGDQVIEQNGVKMLVDERSLPYARRDRDRLRRRHDGRRVPVQQPERGLQLRVRRVVPGLTQRPFAAPAGHSS